MRKQIECRGRSGWFVLRQIQVFGSPDYALAEFYSKQRGKSAPIIFRINDPIDRAELGHMFIDIGNALIRKTEDLNLTINI